MSRLTYIKGPLGYAVSLDGKPYGRISDVRQHGGWLVDVPTLRPTGHFTGAAVFKTVREAKAAIKESLNG